jgi:hypothetical protein
MTRSTGGEPCQEIGEARLFLVPQLVHQRPAAAGGDEHLAGARLAMGVGILARLVDIEGVVGVLDGGDGEPPPGEDGDDAREQGRLARPAPAGQSHHLHRACASVQHSRGH